MTEDMTIRVRAEDLAEIIHAASDARADLETCIRNASEGAEQWSDQVTELLEQFNGFRRAVQEATGLDQRELLHDDELVARIRHDALRSMIRLTDPLNKIPMYDDFQRTGFTQPHDTDEQRAMLTPTMTTTVPGVWGRGDLIEHAGTHGGVYIAKLVEPDADDWWKAVVVRVVRAPEDTAGVFVEQSIRLLENGGGNNRRIWAAPSKVVPVGEPFAGFPESGEQDEPPADQLRQPITGVIPVTDPWSAEAKAAARDDGPPGPDYVPVKGDHQYDAITYAKMIEREQATLAGGTLARFFSDQRPDEGPPTESIPAFEEPPPAVPDPFVIGRMFTRGDSFPDDVSGWWGITTRTGDIWELLKFNGDMAILYCAPLDKTHTWAELTHMHGTVWEMVVVAQGRAFAWLDEWRSQAEQSSVAEQALVDDEAARDE